MPAGLFSGLICWPVFYSQSDTLFLINLILINLIRQIARASIVALHCFSMVFSGFSFLVC
jgi:hypothetical protein